MDNVGKAFHSTGPRMIAVDGLGEVVDACPVEARAEINVSPLGEEGRISFMFDCGIDDAAGSWPFAIDLTVLTNSYAWGWQTPDDKDYPNEQTKAALMLLASAFEAEANRIRYMVANHLPYEPV